MMYVVYILAGLAGGVLTGMAGLTAAMVLTPILCSVCSWSGYDAVTLSLIANVPSAMVTCWTFYKNGNIRMKKGNWKDTANIEAASKQNREIIEVHCCG